jgi:hypothetical protein
MEKSINIYINVYNKLFETIKDNKISLLEIVRNKNQDNIWNNYFKNGEIYRICKEDAYNNDYISKNFNNKKFNLIIENCSYDLESLINFINIYSKLLNNNGILIIENIQSIRYLPTLKDATPLNLHNFIEAYDLREVNDKYDDILFIINKINNKPEEIDIKPEEIINKSEEIDIKPEEIINKAEEIINKAEEIDNNLNIFTDIYELLFRRIKDNELLLLNIGLNEDRIKYLINYFNKSLLFGIGIKNDVDIEIKNNNRIKLYLGTSPFDINLESSNIRFDIILCNNENEIMKIIFIINTYSKILNKNGLLIIEDINEDDIPKIKENINNELKDIMETYKDGNKNIIIINK